MNQMAGDDEKSSTATSSSASCSQSNESNGSATSEKYCLQNGHFKKHGSSGQQSTYLTAMNSKHRF